MDKYEYKLKLDEMKALSAAGDYAGAAEIADSVNWRKVRNVNLLIKAGDVYLRKKRYDDARDLLLMAYDRAPIGRTILYRLAEIAIKTKNFEEAEEYYQEFVEVAPHDNLKYILRFKLGRAKGADIQSQIAILEELKEAEYTEEWAYQLAFLYHQAGESEKCIDACDELILWFGEGIFVERALELKMHHQPLTKAQEDKYRRFKQRRDGIQEVYPKEGQMVSIPVVQEDVEKFNTANLQEELAKSMQQIMDATEKETVRDTMDNVKKIVDEIPYLQMPHFDNPEEKREPQAGSSFQEGYQKVLAEDANGQLGMVVEDRAVKPQMEGQMSIEDVLGEWQKIQRAAQIAIRKAEEQNLESAKARALQEVGEIMERFKDVIPKLDAGITPTEILQEEYLSEGSMSNDERASRFMAGMNDMLQQQIDKLQEEANDREGIRRNPPPRHESDLLRKIKRAKPNFDDKIGLKPYVPRQLERAQTPFGKSEDAIGYEQAEVQESSVKQPEDTEGDGAYAGQPEDIGLESVEPSESSDSFAEDMESSESAVGYAGSVEPSENVDGSQENTEWPEGAVEHIEAIAGYEEVVEHSEAVAGYEEVVEHSEAIAGYEETAEYLDPMADHGEMTDPWQDSGEHDQSVEQSEEMKSDEESLKQPEAIVSYEETIDSLQDSGEYREPVKQPELWEDYEEPAKQPEAVAGYEGGEESKDADAYADHAALSMPQKGDEEFVEPPEEILPEEMRLAEAEFYGGLAETARQETNEVSSGSPLLRQETKEIKTEEITAALDKQAEELEVEIPIGFVAENVPVPQKLNKEQKAIFSYFVPVAGMERQICQTLSRTAAFLKYGKVSAAGNILIQGGSGCGKTVLATALIRALQKEVKRPKGKVGKIDARALNKKDLTVLLKKVAGGCLMIEQAGEMNRETAVKLSLLLESDASGLLVIMEDTRVGLNQALGRDEGLAKKFTEKIVIPVFTSDELVEFGKAYAHDLDYEIDNMGVLALYNRISNIQRLDRATTLTEVKEIVDEAIAKVEKKSFKKALSIITSRRYTEDDYVILREKDFEE